MTPGWDAWFVSGEASGETWMATRVGSVLQIRADGTTSQTTLALSASAYVTGLWVAGPNNAYASAYSNLVLHWDGSGSWKRDIMRSGLAFRSVWGTGPTDVYASAFAAFHSTGDDQWMEQPLSATSTYAIGPFGGTGPTDIWLAGLQGEIFRSTGNGTWRLEASTEKFYVNQIWVASPNEAYFVTNVDIMHRLPSTGRWVDEPNPLGISADAGVPSDHITWLWGSGPNDVYVVTDYGHVLHSNGDGAWQDDGFDPGAGVKLQIRCIWGRNAGDVYLATSNGLYHGVP